MYALACDLLSAPPSEVHAMSYTERRLAANLQARLYREVHGGKSGVQGRPPGLGER